MSPSSVTHRFSRTEACVVCKFSGARLWRFLNDFFKTVFAESRCYIIICVQFFQSFNLGEDEEWMFCFLMQTGLSQLLSHLNHVKVS